MRYAIAPEVRADFSGWLRGKLRSLDFYNRHGDHYLTAEFCRKHGLNATTFGRYIRATKPVLPVPAICRDLADATGENYCDVLMHAGYQTRDDLDAYVLEAIDSGRFDEFCRARFEQALEPVA